MTARTPLTSYSSMLNASQCLQQIFQMQPAHSEQCNSMARPSDAGGATNSLIQTAVLGAAKSNNK